MFPLFEQRKRIDRSRGVAGGASLSLHAIAFFALIHAPAVKLPQPSESEYKQSFAGREEKIVWYKFRRELPKIAPPQAARSNQPLRAENKAGQAIVSFAPNAPKRPRMVWTPVPALHDAIPPDSPNVVAVKLPPPPSKPFTAPAAQTRTAASLRQLPAAPDLAPPAFAAMDLQPALAPKPFSAPVPKPVSARAVVTADAPEISPSVTRPTALNVHLAPKPFTPPPARNAGVRRAPLAPSMDAPELLALNAMPRSSPLANVNPALAPKPFTAPPATHTASRTAFIGSEPVPPALMANSANLNLAVVGLNSVDRPLPPPASAPADFSAGRQIRPTGADSQKADGVLSVPGLFAGNAREKTPSTLISQAFDAPTSSASLRAAMRSSGTGPYPSAGGNEATSHSGAVHVASAPEPRFEGRDVFMMAIQMPNLTSYSGSWLMWYADRTRHEAGLAPIAPPVPHRKVDPKYIASAVADRIEGKVRLACVITREGTVSGVELLRGLDDRLNQSAEEALGKWEFYPATRNGEAVDVDVVVEIPFRLEPLGARP